MRFPQEIQLQILSHFDACDQANALKTCTLWRNMILTETLLIRSRYRLDLYRDTREGLGIHNLLQPRGGAKLHFSVFNGVIERVCVSRMTENGTLIDGPDIIDSPLLDETVCSPYPAEVSFTPQSSYDTCWAMAMLRHAHHMRTSPHGGVAVHFRDADQSRPETMYRFNFFNYHGWKTATIRQMAQEAILFVHGSRLWHDRVSGFTGRAVSGKRWRLQLGVEAADEGHLIFDGQYRFSVARVLQRDLKEGWWHKI
ncbi:hypothetical protein ABW21_db0201388 [Orbilia brochopaga]|nr:hypothetical protein ABW21_db0201388 [Drechslerella brochopaga]